jgi:hypothetical protein
MKKQKTVTDRINNKIKKLNAAYRKATPAQRRVMIAKDALKQLNDGSFYAKHGVYVMTSECHIERDEPLQPHLIEHTPECQCCAKGALFLSSVRLNNKFNGSPDWIGNDEVLKVVEWPLRNLNLIERRFERQYSDDEPRKPNDRLKGILRNIIRNKGTFVP